jgi:hypothetical protein
VLKLDYELPVFHESEVHRFKVIFFPHFIQDFIQLQKDGINGCPKWKHPEHSKYFIDKIVHYFSEHITMIQYA